MLRLTTYFALLVTAFLSVTQAAQAETRGLTLIVDRQTDTVELYLSVSAEAAEPLFGLPKSTLTETDGSVDFDQLRLGTFDIGDDLFAKVDTAFDGRETLFEAMSLMVHPKVNAMPFQQPLDGLIAIEVCTLPTPETPLTLNDLQLYAGFIAYTDTPDAKLTMHLPSMLSESMQVEIRDYKNGALQSVTSQMVGGDTRSIVVTYKAAPPIKVEVIAIAIALLINVCFIALAIVNRAPVLPMNRTA
ncbi:MAG: hypothetical protein AAF729_06800 [Pseudomonadota bacterium]